MTGRFGRRILIAVLLAASSAGAFGQDDLIRLPPIIVHGEAAGPTWYYASMPGFEILSSTGAKTTRQFAQQFYIQFLALREIVPAELQRQTSVPTALILLDEDHEHFLSAQMLAALSASGATQPHLRTPLQLRLFDGESTDLYFVLKDPDIYETVGLGSDYLNLLLAARRPSLPSWFVVAVTELYGQAGFRTGSIRFPAFEWISPAETQALHDDPSHPTVLLSMTDILAGPHQGSALSPDKLRLWQLESALFLRWAIENRGKGRLKDVWKMIEKTGNGPVSEDTFQDCFGLDFTDMQERLRDYLPKAVNDSVSVAFSAATRKPTISPHAATSAQVLRIWGNWERMEIQFVNQRYPHYVGSYIQQADDTFAVALRPGYHDAEVLAVAGLYEADRQNDQQALPALEAAVRGHVKRPSAFVELARLRYEAARGTPGGPLRNLNAEQVAAVMELLQEARRLQPPLPEAYVIAIYAFLNSTEPISKDDWSLLEEGQAFFPENSVIAHGMPLLAARAAR